MFTSLADLASRHPRRVVAAAALFAVVALLVGQALIGSLSAGGFRDPASESVRAEHEIERATGAMPGVSAVALVRPGEAVRSAEGRAEVGRVARRIAADPTVARVLTAFSPRPDGRLVSRDGRDTYIVVFFRPVSEDRAEDAAKRLEQAFAGDRDVSLGGPWVAAEQTSSIIGDDLVRAELIAFPVLLLLSMWVFRGVVAALLPPLMGAITIFGGFLALGLVNRALSISVFALNLVTGLSLGLSIDYSLLVISRFREEMAALGPGREALVRTLATAGRSVLFSGITVAAALAGLMVFPQRFLFSMGLGGVMAAVTAVVVAIVVLPAVLALLGRRTNALAPRAWRRRSEGADVLAESGGWYRLSRFVMRWPAQIAVVSAAVLVVLGVPALGIRFTTVDAGDLPAAASSRAVAESLRRDFPQDLSAPIYLAIDAPRTPAARVRLQGYARRLRALPAVAALRPPAPIGRRLWRADVYSRGEVVSGESQRLVRKVRATPAPYPVAVGGGTALFVDQKASLRAHLPWAVIAVAGVTLLALFLMTGSLLLPLKAIVMNLLTLSAALGILVLIFQDGRLEGLLGYTSKGAVDTTQPILLAVIAFGLSTDYAVFLLSRIKEEHDAGASTADAVAIGLQRTGRIVTAAALLFCVAILAFATSRVVIIKELGIGTAAAVALDASIVRALLVPSLMELLGRWNWWAPRPLRRLHERFGLHEELGPRGA